jgi:hypothetical protein
VSDSVRYIDRTRDYYLAQGYEKPYQWAHFETLPFTRLTKPLAECCVTIVSTSGMRSRSGKLKEAEEQHGAGSRRRPTRSPPTSSSTPFADRMGYDRFATHLDDVARTSPSHNCVARWPRGAPAPSPLAVTPSGRTTAQRRTTTIDAPTILERCREDGIDVALLVPL